MVESRQKDCNKLWNYINAKMRNKKKLYIEKLKMQTKPIF